MPSLAENVARFRTFDSLPDEDLAALAWDWEFWARPEQLEPPGDWGTWLAMAGRGFGKTRLGAEWVRSQVCGETPLAPGKCSRFALVAETAADARDVMVQGPSGILAVHPPEFRPRYIKSDRCLYWPNGAIALLFSAEEPDQLRGPEHDGAWCDEVAKWRYVETYEMLQFGLRIGIKPRQLLTTTPRPIPLVRELLKGEKTGDVVVTRGSTFDNASNLAPSFIKGIREKYEGTRLGRQELSAEVLDDVPGALFTRKTFERRSEYNTTGAGMAPDEVVPDMARVVVAVDPSGASGKKDDESHDDIGVSVCGKGVDGNYYVLEDATCQLGPAGWARRAVEKYREHLADVLVGETNYGGAMVEFTIRAYDSEVPYKAVTASRGKVVRAEPIALLYEQGRVRHAGPGLSPLEDELKDFSRSGYMGAKSPNRADAMVWAMTELMTGDPDYDPNMLAKLLD